ncbi:unnamed protein product [Pleuronectes platessa]|uniref:Uncharacterized protein n=1 Tax=Pleuronectes platessa TaxID=8262 RepID=A0A9N7UNG1_PLEPL|nr:unnamed protein product [Pleuronectes platessa]
MANEPSTVLKPEGDRRSTSVMLVKVKLSGSAEERVVCVHDNSHWLVFRPRYHWVWMYESPPWLCPSLLGVAAGVVRLHHVGSDRRGWFEERRWATSERASTVLHDWQPILR